MRAAVVLEPKRLKVMDIAEPTPGKYQALVQSLAGGLCGTDRHILDGTFYRKTYPGILGHETVGKILKCGPGIRNLHEGDLVLRTTAVYPGDMLGSFHSLLGGLSEYGLVTDWKAAFEDGVLPNPPLFYRLQQVLPTDFDPVDAGAFIVLKETLSWAQRFGISSNSSVVVLGLGPVGISFVRIAKLLGATNVIAVGRRENQLELALAQGADHTLHSEREVVQERVRELTNGRGAEFIIDAAGNRNLLELATSCIAEGGRLGVYALSNEQKAEISWQWGGPIPRNWSMHFHDPDEAGVHKQALDFVRLGLYDLKASLTHTLPLHQIVDAFHLLETRNALKVAITFDRGSDEL